MAVNKEREENNMNTIYKQELKNALMEIAEDGFMNKEVIIEKNLVACLMRLHYEGFKFSQHENRELQDYDDDCAYIDDERVMDLMLHRIVCDHPIEVKRRNDNWNTILHFTHYTDGKHEAYVMTLI